MADSVTVGMAELRAAAAPQKLSVHGLGSCVVLALYDPLSKVGGLAHAMLPRGPLEAAGPVEQPAKFCDLAVEALLKSMLDLGAQRQAIYARLVGGATMFSFPAGRGGTAQALGDRNMQAAREALSLAGIPLKAEEAGGSQGRSLELDPSDGSLMVWSAFQYVRWL